MAKAPIVTETQSREVVGVDANGRQVRMITARQTDGLVTIRLTRQLVTRLEEGTERREWIDLRGLRLLPFQPPAWWADLKEAKRYDAGELCSVGPPDSNSLRRSNVGLVPGLVLQPCPKQADFYQVRQWDASRHRWGPGRAVHYRQLRRAWG